MRLSDQIESSLKLFEGQTFLQKVLRLLRGNRITLTIVTVTQVIFFAWTLTDVALEDIAPVATYYSFLFYVPMHLSFFIYRRKQLVEVLADLKQLTQLQENTGTFHERKIHRKTAMIAKRASQVFCIIGVLETSAILLSPMRDRFLPPPIRRTSVLSLERLYALLIHYYSVCAAGINGPLFMLSELTLILYLRSVFLVLREKLLRCRTAKELMIVVGTHGKLLTISERQEKLFGLWNTLYLGSLLVSSVSTTASFIIARKTRSLTSGSGVTICMCVWYIFCLLGEYLQQSSLGIVTAAYRTCWVDADNDFKKILLTVMIRAGKASVVSGPILGHISLRMYLHFLKQYYRFVQVMKKLK